MDWRRSSRRDYWEISELKDNWDMELVASEQRLVDGWQTIVKNVAKYVKILFYSFLLLNYYSSILICSNY